MGSAPGRLDPHSWLCPLCALKAWVQSAIGRGAQAVAPDRTVTGPFWGEPRSPRLQPPRRWGCGGRPGGRGPSGGRELLLRQHCGRKLRSPLGKRRRAAGLGRPGSGARSGVGARAVTAPLRLVVGPAAHAGGTAWHLHPASPLPTPTARAAPVWNPGPGTPASFPECRALAARRS